MYAAFGDETSITSLTELRNGASSLRQNKIWLSARRNKGLTIESTIFPLYFIDWRGSVELWSGSFFICDGADSTRRAARKRERAGHFCLFHARFLYWPPMLRIGKPNEVIHINPILKIASR